MSTRYSIPERRGSEADSTAAALREKRHRRRTLGGIVTGVVLAGLALLVVAGLAFKATGIEPQVIQPPAVVAGTPTYHDINQNPVGYYGRTVSVRASVTQLITARTFVIGGDGAGMTLLVMDATQTPRAVQLGEQVRVIGQYRTFDLSAIERSTGLTYDAHALQYYQLRPTIVATQIATP